LGGSKDVLAEEGKRVLKNQARLKEGGDMILSKGESDGLLEERGLLTKKAKNLREAGGVGI